MRSVRPALALVLLSALALSGAQPEPKEAPAPPAGWVKETVAAVDKKLDGEIADLVSLYQHLHANPELSFQEVNTAKRLAAEAKKAGFEVTENVGGGVVAVLKNGPGPVVLIRTDMDALPIVEQTGLPYGSKVKTKNRDGVEVGVMHACGHDIHITLTGNTIVAITFVGECTRTGNRDEGQSAPENRGPADARLLLRSLFLS